MTTSNIFISLPLTHTLFLLSLAHSLHTTSNSEELGSSSAERCVGELLLLPPELNRSIPHKPAAPPVLAPASLLSPSPSFFTFFPSPPSLLGSGSRLFSRFSGLSPSRSLLPRSCLCLCLCLCLFFFFFFLDLCDLPLAGSRLLGVDTEGEGTTGVGGREATEKGRAETLWKCAFKPGCSDEVWKMEGMGLQRRKQCVCVCESVHVCVCLCAYHMCVCVCAHACVCVCACVYT